MTNTKPTWRDEWDKLEMNYCCKIPDYFLDVLRESLKKVHDEAYERGQQDCAELNMRMYGTGFIKKKFGDVFKKLSKED